MTERWDGQATEKEWEMRLVKKQRSEAGVRVEGVVAIFETKKALKCVIGEEEVWVPKSVILDDSEVFEEGGEGELMVARWFGENQGWD